MASNEARQMKMPIFAERFNELRGERTQADFAEFLGISRPTVGFYENGERIPDAFVLKQIAEKCDVTTDYLVGLSDNRTVENASIGNVTGLSDKAIFNLKTVASDTNGDYRSIYNAFIESVNFYYLIRYIDIYYRKTAQMVENMQNYIELIKKLIIGEASDDERTPIIHKAASLDEKRMLALFQAQETAKGFIKDYSFDITEEERIAEGKLSAIFEIYMNSEYAPKIEGSTKVVWGYEDVYYPETR